jgi:hypothetical protein
LNEHRKQGNALHGFDKALLGSEAYPRSEDFEYLEECRVRVMPSGRRESIIGRAYYIYE